jgi:hypothetical protein
MATETIHHQNGKSADHPPGESGTHRAAERAVGMSPLWHYRPDGSRYPSREASNAVLGMVTESDSEGVISQATIGDLIVHALIGRPLLDDIDEAPEEWESVEHAFIVETARSLRAVMLAVAGGGPSDDHAGVDCRFTENDTVMELQAITKRMEAGAELLRRLRVARWGNPHFGGGGEAHDNDDAEVVS